MMTFKKKKESDSSNVAQGRKMRLGHTHGKKAMKDDISLPQRIGKAQASHEQSHFSICIPKTAGIEFCRCRDNLYGGGIS